VKHRYPVCLFPFVTEVRSPPKKKNWEFCHRNLWAVRNIFSISRPTTARIKSRRASCSFDFFFLFFFTSTILQYVHPILWRPSRRTQLRLSGILPFVQYTGFANSRLQENHFYSIRPSLGSLKEPQIPPWLMIVYPRHPRVNTSWSSRTVRKDGG
jgi:hypothetical protein